MNPLKTSKIIKQEADDILEKVGVYKILEPYGNVTPTGSYFLDTMVYPDIDVYISKVSIAELFEIGGILAENNLTSQVVFEKSRISSLPGGLYLKARFTCGNWGRPWKLDIWSLEDKLINEKMGDMVRFKEMMTDEVREQIIRYKFSVMTKEKRTPMFSGYFIYKAFLDEGMTDFGEVTRYLIENGINMDNLLE
jgi:hypothetical protein